MGDAKLHRILSGTTFKLIEPKLKDAGHVGFNVCVFDELCLLPKSKMLFLQSSIYPSTGTGYQKLMIQQSRLSNA